MNKNHFLKISSIVFFILGINLILLFFSIRVGLAKEKDSLDRRDAISLMNISQRKITQDLENNIGYEDEKKLTAKNIIRNAIQKEEFSYFFEEIPKKAGK